MSGYYNRDLAFRYIKDVIDKGLSKMGEVNLSDQSCEIWIDYSRTVLELTTKDYNPSILLNYLRIIASFGTSTDPHKKIGACIEYLIGILRIL